MDKETLTRLRQEVRTLLSGTESTHEKLTALCRLLAEQIDHYDWVGFYMVDETHDNELILGPFVGEPTEHIRIAFGQGICGQAAATGQTFIIQDVSQETNYLSCSPDVKAEIVVPIFKGETFVGELDIDSHALAPFTGEERAFLEEVCQGVAALL
ncbi:MAG: GAF domain-containing protein [Anaerolineae bacterium]|jgi:GAF domain-containing protein|nr:GAF domain-containing protein [Anaerolineae bacterium]